MSSGFPFIWQNRCDVKNILGIDQFDWKPHSFKKFTGFSSDAPPFRLIINPINLYERETDFPVMGLSHEIEVELRVCGSQIILHATQGDVPSQTIRVILHIGHFLLSNVCWGLGIDTL